jgi:cell wall-associated NlpC family hydrolase
LSFAVQGAETAPTIPSAAEKSSVLGRRVPLVLLAFALAVALVAVEGPATTQAATTQAAQITNTAKSHIGKPYRWGATGLRAFDCSGLVYRVFAQRGLLTKIGGGRKTARGYYDWFRRRGLATRSNPRKGDLVVWGNARHIGIYVGNGQAVSALTSGVSRHAINRINISFTAYLRVKLTR